MTSKRVSTFVLSSFRSTAVIIVYIFPRNQHTLKRNRKPYLETVGKEKIEFASITHGAHVSYYVFLLTIHEKKKKLSLCFVLLREIMPFWMEQERWKGNLWKFIASFSAFIFLSIESFHVKTFLFFNFLAVLLRNEHAFHKTFCFVCSFALITSVIIVHSSCSRSAVGNNGKRNSTLISNRSRSTNSFIENFNEFSSSCYSLLLAAFFKRTNLSWNPSNTAAILCLWCLYAYAGILHAIDKD